MTTEEMTKKYIKSLFSIMSPSLEEKDIDRIIKSIFETLYAEAYVYSKKNNFSLSDLKTMLKI